VICSTVQSQISSYDQLHGHCMVIAPTYDRGGILVDLVSGALNASVVAIRVGSERESRSSRHRRLNRLTAIH
jgi:hypothetical protein